MREDEIPTHMYFILAGEVKIDARGVEVAELSKGSYLGEIGNA